MNTQTLAQPTRSVKPVIAIGRDSLGRQWYRVECATCIYGSIEGRDADEIARAEADARLMSAAPDLLAAVQSAAWLMQRVAEWDGTGEPITKFAAQVHGDEFRAALAKARGEASDVGR